MQNNSTNLEVAAPEEEQRDPIAVLERLQTRIRSELGALEALEAADGQAINDGAPDNIHDISEVRAAKAKPKVARIWGSRALKSGVAMAIFLAVVWTPLRVMQQSSSAEAVVNARLITLRSPLEGVVMSGALPKAGETVAAGTSLLRIENGRADSAQLDNLKQQLSAVSAERSSLETRLAAAKAEASDLQDHLNEYSATRLSMIGIDISIAQQQIAASQEQARIAATDAQRASSLRQTGLIADASAQRQASTARVAESNLAELNLRLARLRAAQEALSKGIYVDDSYNDRPQSAQRLDEVQRQISELQSQIAADQGREKDLAAAIAQATSQFDAMSGANITIPQNARVWEVLVSPGEQINHGQDVARLLTCEDAVVTASVSERVYNTLYSGMPASFIPRGSDTSLAGTIVNLTGMAGASSNYAISPSSLVEEPYRVAVSVPALGNAVDCAIGRTGRVVFGEASPTTAVGEALSHLRNSIL